MRFGAAILAVAILPAAAHAQDAPAPLVAGAMAESFAMVPDRTVIFAPTADGKIRIVTSTDSNRLAPMLRNSGEGRGVTERCAGDRRIPTCPVRDNTVASDQWPQGYRSIVIGPRTRVGRTTPCERCD